MGSDGDALLARLERCLSAEAWRTLQQAVALASRGGLEIYLVGGAVRDLLLGGGHVDVDLLVEGDAIELASALAASEAGSRLVRHPRFGTASVSGEGFRLDFAMARAERYARPGVLPTVRPALVDADLARRDFAINAMALALAGRAAGRLIDPQGGQRDLKARLVRVLHDRSFQDDATRMLRAARYAGRLDFKLERRTAWLLRRDLSYLNVISGARLRQELERIAAEPEVAAVLRVAAKLGVLTAAHPALQVGPPELRAAARIGESSPRDEVLFCLLLWGASPREAKSAIERLALTGRQAEAVRGLLALKRNERKLARASLRNSDATRLFEPHPLAAIEAFALLTPERLAARRARRYLDEWRAVRSRLDGRDVEALGVARGPRIGKALALLRDARLDGRTKTREDEMALVRRMTHRLSRIGAARG